MYREFVFLRHNKKLKYGTSDLQVDVDFDSIESDKLIVYTFCNFADNIPKNKQKIVNVDATTRFIDEIDCDVAVVGLRSNSPFYANIIWDLVHQLHVGKRIYIVESGIYDSIIETNYYNNAFKLIEHSNTYRVYEKVSELIIEKNRGLSSWTFGIPVGPEEPTILNYCVKRILDLEIEDKEIILCGRPHKNFKYFDKVKIVGENISAPPVHITRKKNEIVRNATKDNLCILHDRVLLPSNFMRAINDFGDMFPLMAFQSIYFADYYNLIPRRYSDFNVLNKNFCDYQPDDKIDKNKLSYAFAKFGCSYQHCQQADFGMQYLTGSLYICKRELWSFCPQDEEYYWDEFEDVEFGLRASRKGIPSIINPFAFTQSINARSIIHFFGSIQIKTISGQYRVVRSMTEAIPLLQRKPIFRVTEDVARSKMVTFARKYNVDEDAIRKIHTCHLSGNRRYKLIFDIVMKSKVDNWQSITYINDYFSLLLYEDINIKFKSNIIKDFQNATDSYSKKMVLLSHPFLLNQLSNSFRQRAFLKRSEELFTNKSSIHKVTSFLTAFCLKYFSRGLYFKLSVAEIAKMITDTTPFRE